MSFSLEQLKAFVTTVETGSFSSAARKLGKAQSVISTAVSNLEIDLDNSLFIRSGRYPKLTPAGERLLMEAQVILERYEHFRGVAQSLGEGIERRLVVAIDDLYSDAQLGALMKEFSYHFPSVELELLFPSMEDVSSLVLENRADLGIMWRQEILPSVLNFHTLDWVSLILVCAPEHELAQQSVEWEELKRYRQLMVSTRSHSEEKARLRVASDVWWVESQWVIVELLKCNLGWAFVPEHVVASALKNGYLVAPTLAFDQHDWPVALEIIWHKQRSLGKAALWLKAAAIASNR